MTKRILVACEESQAVTEELRLRGHEAYSCDLQVSSGNMPEFHYQQDVTELLQQPWDMVIAFPPCTHLSLSGNKHRANKVEDGRFNEAVNFFRLFTNLKHVKQVAIENPIGVMSKLYTPPNQIIQPYMFGHPVSKRTCLWLKGLPLLQATQVVKPEKIKVGSYIFDKWYYETSLLPAAERGKARSKTFRGIAIAMAEQWGNYV